MTSVWKLFYFPPKKQRHWRESKLFLVIQSWRSWSLVTLGVCHLSVVLRQFARNCLHCCKPFQQLYESSGDAEAYGIYSLLASINCVPTSYHLSEILSANALLNLFMQKKIADFRKLSFMLKSTLDHPNSIRKSDASWCIIAETAISNLEPEYAITIKGSRGPTVGKSPPLSVQMFRLQMAIPYLDILIAKIKNHFLGKVVVLVVSASVFNPALLPDNEYFSELMVTLSCQPWLTSLEK